MAYEQVLLEKDGPAAIITLNRPEKLNAFTNQLGRELADAIRACDADDDVRGIIITASAGTGPASSARCMRARSR